METIILFLLGLSQSIIYERNNIKPKYKKERRIFTVTQNFDITYKLKIYEILPNIEEESLTV